MKFRVLQGRHSEGARTYQRGEVIETDKDLLRLNRGSPKFERLDNLPSSEPADELDGLKAADLRQIANKLEIEPPARRADLIIAIRNARKASQE